MQVLGGVTNRYRCVGFHDVTLSKCVTHAYQALAVHELRPWFGAVLWDKKHSGNPGQTVQQVWFPGTHCDVGGGNQSESLSNAAWLWMLHQAESLDLAFDQTYVNANSQADHTGRLFNSSGKLWRAIGLRVRSFGAGLNECRHPTLDQRISHVAALRAGLSTAKKLRRFVKMHVQRWDVADANVMKSVSACALPGAPRAGSGHHDGAELDVYSEDERETTRRNLENLKERKLATPEEQLRLRPPDDQT